jgi:hypothetical protein
MGNVLNLTTIDPNNWIINNTGSIVKDVTLVGGIDELVIENNYSIFPNPSNGVFSIESTNAGNNQLTILDTRGRKISTMEFQKEGKFDLSNQKSGNYIIQITNEKGEEHIKTIVKN